MNALNTERTPHIISAEINTIKQQTCNILLTNTIEISRRVKKAKDLLKHENGPSGWRSRSVTPSKRLQADAALEE